MRRGGIVAAHIAMGLWATTVWADQANAPSAPPFVFRNTKIGDTARAAAVNFALPDCSKYVKPIGVSSCTDLNPKIPSIRWIEYQFFDGNFVGIMFSFDADNYLKVREMLIGAYGKPSQEEQGTVQNAMGAKYDNMTAFWQMREGTLSAEMRFGQIDEGIVSFTDAKTEAAEGEAASKRARAEGATAFLSAGPLPPAQPPMSSPRKPETKPSTRLPSQKQQVASFDGLPQELAKPGSAPLSASETDLVRQQIERCWNLPAAARDDLNVRPKFRIEMNPDGTVRSAELLNTDQLNDTFFQATAESAKRALLNPACQPLKLPPEKFDLWQTFTITFDPKDVL